MKFFYRHEAGRGHGGWGGESVLGRPRRGLIDSSGGGGHISNQITQ